MSYRNPLMVELIVPRDPRVADQIHGFYNEISWDVRNDSRSEFDTLASPNVGAFPAPTIAYWQSESPERREYFRANRKTNPSEYARGLVLKAAAARILTLSENTLIMPSNDAVHTAFDQGGQVLDAHSFVRPRTWAGAEEFRYRDPVGFPLRVTANPGYEVNQSPNSLVGRTLVHYTGARFVVDAVVLSADGFEGHGMLGQDAVFTQVAGGHNPPGTVYSRPVPDILYGAVEVNGAQVPTFSVE